MECPMLDNSTQASHSILQVLLQKKYDTKFFTKLDFSMKISESMAWSFEAPLMFFKFSWRSPLPYPSAIWVVKYININTRDPILMTEIIEFHNLLNYRLCGWGSHVFQHFQEFSSISQNFPVFFRIFQYFSVCFTIFDIIQDFRYFQYFPGRK